MIANKVRRILESIKEIAGDGETLCDMSPSIEWQGIAEIKAG